MAKIFQKNLMISEDVQSYLGTGVFYSAGKQAEVHDGALVSIGSLETSSIYGTGVVDTNVRQIKAYATGDTRLAVVDYVDRSQGEIMGVTYREGIKTAGLVAPAGKRVRYRIFGDGDSFWYGTDNFDGTPRPGKFAVPQNGSTIWEVVDEAPKSGLYLEIETTKSLTEGAVDTDTLYFCKATII